MKNPDWATIFGARIGRLKRETVDRVHEQMKYYFKCILLRKEYDREAIDPLAATIPRALNLASLLT